MPLQSWEDRFDLQDPRLHAEVTERLVEIERHDEAMTPPPPGRDPGWLTTDGFWARIAVPAWAPVGTLFTDGAGFYCFVELFAHDSTSSGFPPSQDPQESGRSGILNAVEMDNSLDVPEDTTVWMTWSEHSNGAGYRFLGPELSSGSGSGSCSIEDETLRCAEAPGDAPSRWTRTVTTDRGCVEATEWALAGPCDDLVCDVTEDDLRCVEGRLYRFRRTLSTVNGCVEAGAWALVGVEGYCALDPPVGDPPCLVVVPDFRCITVDLGAGPVSMQARYEKRIFLKDGCLQEGPLTYVGLTGVCCDCPEECEECPACDPEDGVATACCPAVPCELCLSLLGPGLCVAVNATLVYDPLTPVGECLCGWATAAFNLGACEVTATLVCLPAGGGTPPRWQLRIAGTTPGLMDVTATLATIGCGPPLDLFGLLTLPADEGCCAAGGGMITASVGPLPCGDPGDCEECENCDEGVTGFWEVELLDVEAPAYFVDAGINSAVILSRYGAAPAGQCWWVGTNGMGGQYRFIRGVGTWSLTFTCLDGADVKAILWQGGGDCCGPVELNYFSDTDSILAGAELATLTEDVPCCGGPVGGPCCGCAVVPSQWAFTVAGVTDDSCGTCTDYNAAWTITLDPATCIWSSAALTDPCTPGPAWRLYCDDTDWILQTSSSLGNEGTYKKSRATWNCLAANVMARTSDHSPSCADFPATITLTPV